jgi:hypothetical protein
MMENASIDELCALDIPRRQKRKPINLKPGDVVKVRVKDLVTYARDITFKNTPKERVEFVGYVVEQDGEDCIVSSRKSSCFGADLLEAFAQLKGRTVWIGKKAEPAGPNWSRHRLVFKVVPDEEGQSDLPEAAGVKAAPKVDRRVDKTANGLSEVESKILGVLEKNGPQECKGLGETAGIAPIDAARAIKDLSERGLVIVKDGWIAIR